MSAPYYYYGLKSFAEKVYPELRGADLETYKKVKQKYHLAFLHSRPYEATVSPKGIKRFPSEWNRTLINLKAMYGYVPPTTRRTVSRAKPTTPKEPKKQISAFQARWGKKNWFATEEMAKRAYSILKKQDTQANYYATMRHFERIYAKDYLCAAPFDTAWRRLLKMVKKLHGADYLTGNMQLRPTREIQKLMEDF